MLFRSTQFRWFGIKLTPENAKSLVIPEGFGHAFITLQPNSTVTYVVSNYYAPEYESGFRYDDPTLKIEWPIEPTVVSEKDVAWRPVANRLDELERRLEPYKSS